MSRTGRLTSRAGSVLAALLACAASLTAHAQLSATEHARLVKTQQGLVRGVIEDGLVVFRGIPYAAPPIGPRRWKPPQPPARWEGVREVMGFGPPCPSVDLARAKEGRWIASATADIWIGIPMTKGSSEDCLHINIWAPVDARRAAVMVWIQPLGASSLPVFDGAAFARDGVVFVSLDYRQLTLGNFAHPSLTAEATADAPLARFQTMDQMAALRWIKDNIAAFGADPSNVTVFGLSASAASVLQLLTLPAASGLIDKAIVESGVGWWTPLDVSQMERLGSLLATFAGLPGMAATAEQLRALPPDALPQIGVYSVDGRMQPENATTMIDVGNIADVPLLIGWTSFDGSSLRGRGPEDVVARASGKLLSAYAGDGLSGADLGYQMYTDGHVAAPARWIARKASRGAPSYLYLFSYVRTANRNQVRGAAHGDELAFVFDTWDKALPELELSDEDRRMTHMMHSCWVGFAKTGKPSCKGVPDWPRYTTKGDELVELGLNPVVRRHFRTPQLDAQENAWRAGVNQAASDVEESLRQLEETEGGHTR